MKQTKSKPEVVTRGVLEEVLQDYPTKKDLTKILENYPTKNYMHLELGKMFFKFDERAKQYRDDVLTKMDQIIGELSQIREDRVFENYEVKQLKEASKNHEKRITKLERAN